jgi:hypothetical protein
MNFMFLALKNSYFVKKKLNFVGEILYYHKHEYKISLKNVRVHIN